MEGHDQPKGLSAEEIQREEAFLADVPLLNLGALFMPPIWGMAHGDFATILFYPLWIFCDNLFYSAWTAPSVMSVAFAVVVFVVMAVVTVGYARLSSVKSAHEAAKKGKSLEQYLKTERRWAIAMGIMALVMIVAATWYNLCIRPTLG